MLVLPNSTTVLAQEKALPESVERMKQAYEQAVARSAAPLQTQYESQLSRLLQKYTQAGKLDEALAIKAEMAGDTQTAAQQAKLPAEVRNLKTQHQKALATAVEPLRRNYIADLNKQVIESTRASRLEEALAIREEIKKVPGAPAVLPPVSAPGTPWFNAALNKRKITVSNVSKAREADAVVAAAEEYKPELFTSVKDVELVYARDFSEGPMKHNNDGKLERVQGSHAKDALTTSANGMVVWGPYDKLDEGNYIIVYRVRFFDKGATGIVAFLDVAQGGVTQSGLNAKAEEVPAGDWLSVPLSLKVPEKKDYEYRFWGRGKQTALDRVYVFRVKSGG